VSSARTRSPAPTARSCSPLIAESLDAIEHSDLPKGTKQELTSMLVDNLIYDAARRHAELLLMLRIATGAVQFG
jgi:hypothetical protein